MGPLLVCFAEILFRQVIRLGACLDTLRHTLGPGVRSGFLIHAKNQNCDNDQKSDLEIRSDF